MIVLKVIQSGFTVAEQLSMDTLMLLEKRWTPQAKVGICLYILQCFFWLMIMIWLLSCFQFLRCVLLELRSALQPGSLDHWRHHLRIVNLRGNLVSVGPLTMPMLSQTFSTLYNHYLIHADVKQKHSLGKDDQNLICVLSCIWQNMPV